MTRKTKAEKANPPCRRQLPKRQCTLKNRCLKKVLKKVKPRIVFRKTYQHEGKVYKATIDSKETMYVEVNGENIYTAEYETKKIRTFHMVKNPSAKKRRALRKSNRASRVSRVMATLVRGITRKYVFKEHARINAEVAANAQAAVQVIRAGEDPRLANVRVAPNVPFEGRNNGIIIQDEDYFRDSGNEDDFSGDENEDL